MMWMPLFATCVRGEILILIDSDILIWSSKNNANAQLFLLQTADKAISVVTYMELLEGFRNKQEQRAFEYYITELTQSHKNPLS